MTDATDSGSSRWKTFGERVIYDNPWVWLGQVDVELPDGERFWHHVVRLHRAAMMVLVDEQDRVLLLWRHRFVQDRWGWELPGGLIDEGEEPAETAVRELEEETGYRAGRVEHLITFQPMVGMVDSEHVVFVGRDAGEDRGADRDDRGRADGVGAARVGTGADRCWGDLELRVAGRVAAAADAGSARRPWRSAWTGRGCGGAGGLIR